MPTYPTKLEHPLARWLADSDYTHRSFAKLLGVHWTALGRWFRYGNVSLPYVEQVSRITGIPVSKLSPDAYGSGDRKKTRIVRRSSRA